MTVEEEKEMGKKIAQSQKPDVGRMIADEIREEQQGRMRRGRSEEVPSRIIESQTTPTKTTLPMKPGKRTGWRTAERSALVPCCPQFLLHLVLECVKDGTKDWL